MGMRDTNRDGAAARQDSELLLAVFRFKNQRPSATQTEAFCWRLRDAFATCVDEIVVDINVSANTNETDAKIAYLNSEWDDRSIALDVFTPQECVWLCRGWTQLFDEPSTVAVGDVWTLQWFPAYGTVLQAERVSIDTVALRVLALDGWEWTRHFVPSGECIDSAVPTKHIVFSCGRLPSMSLSNFQAKFKAAMATAAQLTGSHRSAASASATGVTGHQKTPQFLVAMVRTVLDDLAETTTTTRASRMPRGGMTDVGLHTGGAARDTCWPLVCAALRQALPKYAVVFHKVLLFFHGWLLEKMLPLNGRQCFEESSAEVFWRSVDEGFEMLEAIVDRATRLDQEGYDAIGILANCETWRMEIDVVVAQWSQAQADTYRFEQTSPQQRQEESMAYPKLAAPDQKPFDLWQSTTTNDYATLHSTGNTEYVLLKDEPRSAVAILVFLESIEPQQTTKTLVGVRVIETFLFKYAATLNDPVSRDLLVELEPEPLLDLMTWYCEHAMTNRLDDGDSRRVQRQSVYSVLTWITFCLAHRYCCEAFVDVRQHRIALDWRDLEVCVLHEASCRTALLHVARYMHDWNTQAESSALFDLSNQAGTFALARRLGQSLPIYQAVYLELVSRLRLVCESQWAAIAARKTNLEIVRQEIASYSTALTEMKHRLAAEEDVLRWEWKSRHPYGKPPRYLENWQTQVFGEEICRLTDLVRQKTAFRDELLQMPEFAVSPVPLDEEDALQLLCLLGPPKPIDILAELCWQAQRALIHPSSGGVENLPSGSFWRDHIEDIVGELPFEDHAQHISAFASAMEIPPSCGPNSIDDVSSAKAYADSCVWFPSASGTTILWRDKDSEDARYINPFQLDHSESKSYFTPEVSTHTSGDPRRQDWLWAVSYPGDNGPERGNLTYAQRSMAVEDGDGENNIAAFSIVGSLRAYPTQQLRRIFAAVASDSLVWSDKLVGIVLRQALYQVGVISIEGEAFEHSTASFLWHPDLADEASVRQYCVALTHVIEDIQLSPRRWDCIPLLSEVATFLSQFDDTAKASLMVLARTAHRWAIEIRSEWQREAVLEDAQRELRSRECILYGYGVLCLDEPLDEEEVAELCELLVLFHNAKLFAGGTHIPKVESLAARIDWMMANRVVALVKAVNSSPHKTQLLTRLAALVLPKTPDRIEWRHIQAGRGGGISSCFVGVNPIDGSTTVINLFSGAVTSNGGHPISLPHSISSLLQYRSLFGDRELEVIYTNGVYETTAHAEHVRQYRFYVLQDTSELSVEEVGNDYMLQLCAGAWRNQLEAVLPARLALLYSHWYWTQRRTVLLRGLQVTDTGVYYVLRFDVNGTARCYEVPRQDRLIKYSTLLKRLSDYPMLVVGDAKIVAILSKFEEPEFIHTVQQPQPPHALEVCLPRFGLRFVRDVQGRFASLSHRGYVLSEQQQLTGQMLCFRQYLLLDKQDAETENRRLLVPMGPVRMSEQANNIGLVEIEVSDNPAAAISFLTIDRHDRLEVYTPETIEARLQLAAIYAASGSRLPWTEVRMTGGEAAIQLLRGCTPSRPFSAVAHEYLVAIATRYAFRTPVLAVFVGLLLKKSRRLAFLFDDHAHDIPTVDTADALDEYRNQVGNHDTAHRVPIRQQLTRSELCDLLGSTAAADLTHARSIARREGGTNSKLVFDLEDDQIVTECEREIEAIYSQSSSLAQPEEDVAVPPFPLSLNGSNTMSTRMLDDLQASWITYHRHHRHSDASTSPQAIRQSAQRLRVAVQAKLRLAQQTLDQFLRTARDMVCDRLARTVSRQLELTFPDVMRSVVDQEFVLQALPFRTPCDRDAWNTRCLYLLELCVLDDKLERLSLEQLDTGEDDGQDDLGIRKREWDPRDHPYWLVFEVESRLQIRHEQYVIALHLLENPGSICQLNMGRGKTRVILPMLFLYYSVAMRTNTRQARFVRAHFLSPLLSETRELFWKVLTASVLTLPFVELPFNRSCSLTLDDARMIQHVLEEAKRNGAIIMLAPEHRLSLELERVELGHRRVENEDDSVQIGKALDALLDPHDFIDIFDESDALLHHGYHLVYAIGASKALDSDATRWLTAEALLRVLISPSSTRVQQTLQRFPDAWSIQFEYQDRVEGGRMSGIYNGFRLHSAGGSAMQTKALRIALIEDLIDKPPFELEWLRLFDSNAEGVRASLIRLLSDASVDPIDAMQQMLPAIRHVKDHVLALRGLLAFNILETCLQKRYRVEYGHPPTATRQKAIAIPFQAADLPAERSEFSHPDVGVVLTLLAFYHSGLSEAQVHRAFQVLLSLDESESLRYYNEWFASVASQILDPAQRAMLSSLTHISLENAHQFAVVSHTYRFAMEVINFYVNSCVFPRDTRQFPHRLARSAWDLVRSDKCIGFSGTKDTHYLLPHGVRQHEPDEPALRGTNGKMVQRLLDATRGYVSLSALSPTLCDQDDEQPSTALACWQALLLLAVEKQSNALIDTGALLAGVSNHDAAAFLLSIPTFAFQGVTYYDTRPPFDAWVVLEKDRDWIHYHKNSSLRERDTFVIFDEARARGSDMKLAPRAIALLTLGPRITKDTLMQGAGRMRLLGACHQTLWLTSTHEVFESIARQSRAERIDVVAVLNWVMDNTQRQCTVGLLEWAQSGIQFYTKRADPAQELQDDDWTLEGQYGEAQTERLIAEIIQSKLDKQADVLSESEVNVVRHIQQHGETFGRQDAVYITKFDEECEREMQIEEEQQETREHRRHDVAPCTERPWNWRSLLHAVSVDSLCSQDGVGIDIVSLADAVRMWFVPPECGEVAWEATNIFATANYWSTVSELEDTDEVEHLTSSAFVWTSCLRDVHTMVVFADKSVLLLSEYEENAVLAMLHNASAEPAWRDINLPSAETVDRTTRGCFGVVHLPFAVDSIERMEASSVGDSSARPVSIQEISLATGWTQGHVTVASQLVLPFLAVVACCLLNGDTELFMSRHTTAAEAALRTLLACVRHREETLQTFLRLRGFTGRWKRSSLHAIARRMDLEEAMRSVDTPQPTPQKTKPKLKAKPKPKKHSKKM